MPLYRVDLLGRHGKCRTVQYIQCVSDLDAFDCACLLVPRDNFELWQNSRMVVAIDCSWHAPVENHPDVLTG